MKASLFALVLAVLLALPSSSEAGLIRRFLARRAAPRAAAVQVNVGRVGVNVAVQRQRGVAIVRGHRGLVRVR